MNHPLVLIIPNSLSVFYMIIMRTFFYSIPDSLRESAEIDGAGPIKILTSIYLPLSKPVMATLALFYAVGRWNGFSDALMYMNDRKYHPIQLLLYNILNAVTSIEIQTQEGLQHAWTFRYHPSSHSHVCHRPYSHCLPLAPEILHCRSHPRRPEGLA